MLHVNLFFKDNDNIELTFVGALLVYAYENWMNRFCHRDMQQGDCPEIA